MEDQIKRVYATFRNKFDFDLSNTQLKIISNIVQGKDVFAVLPTGGGKSMTFIVPPLLTSIHNKSTALVISPLLALSINQKNFLRERNISACVLQKEMPKEERKDLKQGRANIILSSPEMLLSNLSMIENIYSHKICVLAFDEVHCVSEWGNDFRPQYRKMSGLRSLFNAPVLALSATVTKKIQRDVVTSLCMDDDTVFVAESPDRPEIFFSVRRATRNFAEELGWVVNHIKNYGINAKKIVIYTQSINECSKLYKWLIENLESNACVFDNEGCMLQLIEMYHAHLTAATRDRVLTNFTKLGGYLKVVVATVAFGMGVQIPDISVIVQWGLPSTLLDFWQMSGRCARGKDLRGISITYCIPSSILRTKDFTLRSMSETSECLRSVVLRELSIAKSPPPPPIRAACTLHCATSCKCSFCMCCDICRNNCKCVKKSKDVINEILLKESEK